MELQKDKRRDGGGLVLLEGVWPPGVEVSGDLVVLLLLSVAELSNQTFVQLPPSLSTMFSLNRVILTTRGQCFYFCDCAIYNSGPMMMSHTSLTNHFKRKLLIIDRHLIFIFEYKSLSNENASNQREKIVQYLHHS